MARHIDNYLYGRHLSVKHYHYPSYKDLMDQKVPSFNQRIHDSLKNESSGHSWWGVSNYDAVIRTVSEGWKEGLRVMENHLKEMEIPRKKSTRRRKMRANQGNELDIHRVYSGNVDKAWSLTRKVESFSHMKKGKRVCVVLDVTTRGIMGSDEAFWRGACAVMLIKSLMNKGYSVELNIARIARNKYRVPTFTAVTLCAKEFNQRMNLELIAALTSVGFYRGPMLQAVTKNEEKEPRGLGNVMDDADKIPLPYFDNRANMLIRISNIFSKAQALKFAEKVKNMTI